MKQIFIVIFAMVMPILGMAAHPADSVVVTKVCDRKSSSLRPLIVPAAIISAGVFARTNGLIQSWDHAIRDHVRENVSARIHLDDYIQYAPATFVYGLDLMGVKAKHNFRDRTFVVATSYLLTLATVSTLKSVAGVERPDGSNNHSFPSGHTATAFTGAHILFREYKDTSPWIGVAGYLVAGTTGALRVYNKKHWVADVVMGAGMAMLNVELSYLLLPSFQRRMDRRKSAVTVMASPVLGYKTYGLGMSCSF